MTDRPMVLRPPAGQGFGGTFTVPPDFPQATLDHLLSVGYSIVESKGGETAKPSSGWKRKDQP